MRYAAFAAQSLDKWTIWLSPIQTDWLQDCSVARPDAYPEVQRLNPMAEPGRCVAADAVDFAELAARGEGGVLVGAGLERSEFRRGFATVYSHSSVPEEAVQQLRAAVRNADGCSTEYIHHGVLTRDLLASGWMIAKIIGSFRQVQREMSDSVLIPFDFPSTDDCCLNDVAAIFAMMDREAFRARQRCLLRPAFRCENPVALNQPYFVIDDMLIDVKCTARKGLDRRDVDQLLRYYALSKIEGLADQRHGGEINRLAIYYARFGQLFVIDVRKDFPPDRVTKFLEWFEQKYRRTGEAKCSA
ncbi:MAG: hypothetical protein EXR36_10610 [Betaproteobacteria bacterium]|nr:hypothetical protein [Betaproteobacteria bacterium]